MVAIVRTDWSGTSGGPGLTQMAVLGGTSFDAGTAQAAVDAVRTFWDTIKNSLPSDLTLQVLAIVDVYNEATGDLTASYSAPVTPAPVTGTNSTSYAGGVGVKVTWNTGAILNGRRVRGSTYIVPTSGATFTANGTVAGGSSVLINGAATTLIANLIGGGAPLLVWSRPAVLEGGGIRPGVVTGVLGGSCSSKSAILRGRRD